MSGLSIAFRKLRSLSTFSAFEIALVIPVLLGLGLARLAIAFLPFRRYARPLGAQSPLDTSPPSLTAAQLKRAKRIGRVVRSTARVTPWASLCLAQAMVASALLRLCRLPYCVVFGLSPNTGPDLLDAHAWVAAGNAVLTGGHGLARYTIVMVFAHPAGTHG